MAEQVVGQASTEVSMGEDVNVGKLSFPAMLSLVVGSMIGGGIFRFRRILLLPLVQVLW